MAKYENPSQDEIIATNTRYHATEVSLELSTLLKSVVKRRKDIVYNVSQGMETAMVDAVLPQRLEKLENELVRLISDFNDDF